MFFQGKLTQVWRGHLWAPTMDTKKEVAVKILREDSTERERRDFMAESRIMRLTDHENVVRIKGISSAIGDGKMRLMMILEYCNGKWIFTFLVFSNSYSISSF